MLPLLMAHPHRDVMPHAYVVMHHTTHCQHCGAIHSHAALYAKTHLRSQHGLGKYVTNLRALYADAPQYNLPIEHTLAKPDFIAFCQDCYAGMSLAHLPPPPQTEPHARDALLATDLVRNSPQHPDIDRAAKPRATKSRAHKPVVTTDDLAL
jgi:hypothetical protein